MDNLTKQELEQMRDAALKQLSIIDATPENSYYYLRNQSKRAELLAFLAEIDKQLLYRYDDSRRALSALLQQRDPLRFARRR